MPWSPIPKFPDVIEELKRRGYTKQVRFEELKAAIMLHTGVYTSGTIRRIVQAMETLGYIRLTDAGTAWDIVKRKKR